MVSLLSFRWNGGGAFVLFFPAPIIAIIIILYQILGER